MVVPRTQIYRIARTKTAYDQYAEQLARLREGDGDGLFRLATWCRSADGLRVEADELLAKVISLNEDHTGARRLLGHVKAGKQWTVPPPLEVQLQIGGPSSKQASDLRARLTLFLETRKDLRKPTP